MIVGLFGISGSGKTYLSASINSKYDVITTRASQIIKEFGHEIEYHQLNSSVVDQNQLILIRGLDLLDRRNPNKLIIIELHNVLETPEGLVEVAPQVLLDLNLSAACFLEVPIESLYQRRINDSSRRRPQKNMEELKTLQLKSIHRFEDDFKNASFPSIILKNTPFHELEIFLKSLTRLHPKHDV